VFDTKDSRTLNCRKIVPLLCFGALGYSGEKPLHEFRNPNFALKADSY
jgi:hypothetical protein